MKLLKKLDLIRKQSGLSRAAWLRRAHIAESTWYRWQSGENSPTLDVLERLGVAVEVSENGRLKKNACKCASGL